MELIQISESVIDLGAVQSALRDPRCGAQLVFLGVVRNSNEGKPVIAVHYQTYLPLANAVFQELAREAREMAGVDIPVVLMHRMGRLDVGEISTVVAVSTPHRALAYDVSRYLIEQLKSRFPAWKEEEYVGGERHWLEGVDLESPEEH